MTTPRGTAGDGRDGATAAGSSPTGPVTVTIDWARHGQNVANVTHTMSHRVFDADLTQGGIQEAERLAERLYAAGRHYATITTSPLRRARQTAAIVAARIGGPEPVVSEELRELDVGVLDGRSDPATWRVYDDVLEAWHAGDLAARFPGGESGGELVARLRAALAGVARASLGGAALGGAALVVAHGANIRAALPALTGRPDPGADLRTAHLARLAVTVEEPGGRMAVALLGWEGSEQPGPTPRRPPAP